jgi:hypothetical protein
MALKTVSAAGGNFNVGATWVGGVAPVNGDTIKADATSGNLTLTANTVNIYGADFTGYTRTLALGGANLTLTGVANIPVILGASMSITNNAGSGARFAFGAATPTLTSNGVTVPAISQNGTGPLNLVGTLTTNYITNTSPSFAGANVVINGSGAGSQTFATSGFTIASPYKVIFRTTGTYPLVGGGVFNGNLQIDTTSTLTVTSALQLDGATGSTFEITKQAVFSKTPTLLYLSGTTHNINAYTYSLFTNIVQQPSTTGLTNVVNILSASVSVDNLLVNTFGFASDAVSTLRLGGSYSCSIKSLLLPASEYYSTSATAETVSRSANLILGAFTYSVSDYLLIGGAGGIRSQLTGVSPSNTTVNFTGNTYSITTAAINTIKFTGTPLYYLNNTNVLLTSTTGITLAGSGGGGGGSFTFVS